MDDVGLTRDDAKREIVTLFETIKPAITSLEGGDAHLLSQLPRLGFHDPARQGLVDRARLLHSKDQCCLQIRKQTLAHLLLNF